MEELLLGRRYRTIEMIGTGGMADVYRAVDETLGRTVALKVMHARLAADPEFTARFRQEAQAAANLASPNIVHMYDWGQDAGTYYIVMEYVQGSDLKAIEQAGALASHTVAEIGVQVCSALSVAHGYDVIHRDIKPHNIMVQPNGAVKVMDFGIARAGNTTMTQVGSVLGTAQYISPEQAQGKPLTAASDLYSLGVVLYEAATGRLPFEADSPVAVALMQVNEQAVAPQAVNPGIDPGLEAVIVKAMQKDPGERYVSADDMRRDLRVTALASEAETAVMSPVVAKTAKLPVIGSGGGNRVTPARRDGAIPAETGPGTKRRRVWPWLLAALLLVAAGFAVASNGGLFSPREPTPVPNKGPDTISVPSVVGMTEAEAIQALQRAGFRPQALPPEFRSDVPAGIVCTQTPQGDAMAARSALVNYALSRGPEPIVPDPGEVKGKSGKPKGDKGKGNR